MIYTVVLNSRNYHSATDPANSGIRNYAIDWSFLPQGKHYKVSFTFKSSQLDTNLIYTAENLIQVNVSFTGSPSTYLASSTVSKNPSNFLGLVYVENVSAARDQRFSSSLVDNTPIYLQDRPSNNIFEVKLTYYDNVQAVLACQYILTLNFEEID